jgi:hypothetical protein
LLRPGGNTSELWLRKTTDIAKMASIRSGITTQEHNPDNTSHLLIAC